MKLPEKMMRFGAEFMIKYAEGMALPNKDEQSIRKFLLNIEDRTLRIVVADTLFTVMSAMGKQGMTLG
ncbi:MAG TPA: hypothetical protein VLE43_16180 [Candidatus Saccharimonadia bacterium]|nr:hypothetical protein [Candidatus Saccharimonadia bacterium]